VHLLHVRVLLLGEDGVGISDAIVLAGGLFAVAAVRVLFFSMGVFTSFCHALHGALCGDGSAPFLPDLVSCQGLSPRRKHNRSQVRF